eukprot:12400535-Karenia_brevis.AAC.1
MHHRSVSEYVTLDCTIFAVPSPCHVTLLVTLCGLQQPATRKYAATPKRMIFTRSPACPDFLWFESLVPPWP